MTDEQSPDSASRRARLATRRQRLRVVGAVVAVVLVVAGVSTAVALRESDAGPTAGRGQAHARPRPPIRSTTLNLGDGAPSSRRPAR